jgi:hypothetical protein
MVTIAYLDQIQGVPSRNQLIPNDLFSLSLNQNARPENIISNLQRFIVRSFIRTGNQLKNVNYKFNYVALSSSGSLYCTNEHDVKTKDDPFNTRNYTT